MPGQGPCPSGVNKADRAEPSAVVMVSVMFGMPSVLSLRCQSCGVETAFTAKKCE